MKPLPYLLLVFAALVLIAPDSSHAEWIQNGIPISTNGNTLAAGCVSDGAGGAIVVMSTSQSGSFDIFAQRLNGFGVTQWITGGLPVSTAVNDQLGAAAIPDGAGGAIIAWEDFRGVDRDVYVQRINSSGTSLWTPGGVPLCTATNVQVAVSLVSDGAGGAIVAWQDLRSGTSWDVYARRVDAAGVRLWTANGVALCTLANTQSDPQIVADGVGGAIVTWSDSRTGTSDIYAQRINSTGTTLWTANGNAVCTAVNAQSAAAPVSDGAGGAIIAWDDARSASRDIYVQHLNASGSAQWFANGIAICQAVDDQSNATITTDGANGAIIMWQDERNPAVSEIDLYAQRIDGTGEAQWDGDGLPVCVATGAQNFPVLVSNNAGGAIAMWSDERSADGDIYSQFVSAAGVARWQINGLPLCTATGNQVPAPNATLDASGALIAAWSDQRSTNSHVYAQRAEPRYGYWGRPEPTIVSAEDNPGDQGGKVILRWASSQRDRFDNPGISHYSIWRSTDFASSQAAGLSASSAGVVDNPLDIPRDFAGTAFWAQATTSGPEYWEWVANQDAFYNSTYSYTAATRQDSVGGEPAIHYFKVMSHEYDSPQTHVWESATASAYSVDNVAPTAPILLAGSRIEGGSVQLTWKSDTEIPDLAHYTIYRSGPTDVAPTPLFFLDVSDAPSFLDLGAPSGPLHYVVTATDVHGNESLPSNIAALFDGTPVDGDTPPITALRVLQNHPNPFAGATELQIGLPSASDVEINVFDVGGRRVSASSMKNEAAGWRRVSFSGLDNNGRPLPSGVYFYRVKAAGSTITKKMVIAR